MPVAGLDRSRLRVYPPVRTTDMSSDGFFVSCSEVLKIIAARSWGADAKISGWLFVFSWIGMPVLLNDSHEVAYLDGRAIIHS